MIEFKPWEKIARLNRDITITEKIDGTNGAIGIEPITDELIEKHDSVVATWWTYPAKLIQLVQVAELGSVLVYAQSRKAIISPDRDNHGFARWVWDNAEQLAVTLGPGVHFGEWWGSGIQRGYGLPKGEKRFSLFNTKRWNALTPLDDFEVPGLRVVPVIYEGPFDENKPDHYVTRYPEELYWPTWITALDDLKIHGSFAAPGFMQPEGVVIYHHAANMMFKVTLENDEAPKGVAA